ncbi:hypothetical protein PTKIN_Ptkin05aG0124300 [Pterospermum kingtungense]
MSPVSLCMLLVVFLVYSLSPSKPFSSFSLAPIRIAANLVYLENPSDTAATKFEGALLNALVFVVLIVIVTILIILRQGYMVSLGIIVAAWFTKLSEWTTWVLLVALALYDLVALLSCWWSWPQAEMRNCQLWCMKLDQQFVTKREINDQVWGFLLLEFQILLKSLENVEGERHRDKGEMSPLVGHSRERYSSNSNSSEYSTVIRSRESEIVIDEEVSPLVNLLGMDNGRDQTMRDGMRDSFVASRGIKLGLGDFVFYSVMVCKAAMYDLIIVYSCYLAIISGLQCTLILLSVYRQALPDLPISITLGVFFSS